MHPCHITAHRSGFAVGATPITQEGEAHDCCLDFSIVKLRAGEQIVETSSKETAWVLLDGRATVTVEGTATELARTSVFDEKPSVVHMAAHTRVSITALLDVEWACVRTSNEASFTAKVFLPHETSSEARGKGLVGESALRAVRLTFDLSVRPESMLVLGEVVHASGRWSSYPPHHHGQPELYHYRFTKPQGYGHAELGDDVLKVKHNDTVKILGSVDHPQVAAPGYGMYYLWVVRHQPGSPYRGFTYAPEHEWILKATDGFVPQELL